MSDPPPTGGVVNQEHPSPGLLVERGSLLSHSAIVAREMRIPCIVSVPGVTTWLKDGDVVEMDGATGVVRRAEVSP